MDFIYWASWGLAGAFVYAMPKLLLGLQDEVITARKVLILVVQLLTSLLFGPIFAAGFGPWVVVFLKLNRPEEAYAVALVIGMISNVVAPALISLAGSAAVQKLTSIFGAKPDAAP